VQVGEVLVIPSSKAFILLSKNPGAIVMKLKTSVTQKVISFIRKSLCNCGKMHLNMDPPCDG
jgi:hypothetical protein